MFEGTLLVLGILYAAGMVFFAVVALFVRYPHNRNLRPRVSVIIAARNEEANVGRCLDAVSRLTYPRELFEVIVINDRSSDATPSIISDYAGRFPVIRRLDASPGTGHLMGKTNAVAQGIAASTGEILMLTDADCSVPPGWIEETVKYYTDDTVGLVPGFTAIRHENLFEAMQTMDWFVLFTVAAATTKVGFPVTAVGTNFTVRRSAYDAVGGYQGIPFSVTEDYALYHAVTSRTKYRARFPMDAGTVVESEPCPTLKDLYRQRKRWFTGGKGMDAKSIFIFLAAWLLNAGIIAGLFLDMRSALIALAMKVGADFLLTLPVVVRFRRWGLLGAFPLDEVYYYLYVLLFPPIVISGSKVVWKDRVHR
ncbi:MAG: glycosyltransferase [Bacteroidetes bacterium]|nr:glycosyltransferase [Bacteroidota bacterium]